MAGRKSDDRKSKKSNETRERRTAALLKRLTSAGVIQHRLMVLGKPEEANQLSGSEKTVDVEIVAEEAEAWINGIPLALSGGTGSADVLPGHHILSFEVRGAPGTQWSVKITAPPEAKGDDSDTFDESGFDVGRIKFVVGA
jgi:hypothetical protein